ncbi:hypothetical protein Tco_0323483 [Tanacetum coccineum]
MKETTKRLLRKRKATISKEQPSKKPKLRTETIDELRNYLRVVDFENNAQELRVIRRNLHDYRAPGLLILLRENTAILDRQDLYHLHRVVQDYYEHIPPTGLEWEITDWRVSCIFRSAYTRWIEDCTMSHIWLKEDILYQEIVDKDARSWHEIGRQILRQPINV